MGGRPSANLRDDFIGYVFIHTVPNYTVRNSKLLQRIIVPNQRGSSSCVLAKNHAASDIPRSSLLLSLAIVAGDASRTKGVSGPVSSSYEVESTLLEIT